MHGQLAAGKDETCRGAAAPERHMVNETCWGEKATWLKAGGYYYFTLFATLSYGARSSLFQIFSRNKPVVFLRVSNTRHLPLKHSN